MANYSNTIVSYPTPVIEKLVEDQNHYIYLQIQLQYMASHLQSTLLAFANWNQDVNNQK